MLSNAVMMTVELPIDLLSSAADPSGKIAYRKTQMRRH
jgi:hypothetical protein